MGSFLIVAVKYEKPVLVAEHNAVGIPSAAPIGVQEPNLEPKKHLK